jgi:Clp amino terminal domain, pathogenicity island component
MYPFERFTEEAKKVLTLAQEEAERSHHSYIGTEHLLLGIMRQHDGPGGQALSSLNVDIVRVRQTIDDTLGVSERVAFQQIIPTSRVKKVIELSFEEARRQGHEFVDSGHMLIALMQEGEGIAARVLQDLGATMEKVTAAVKNARKESARHIPVVHSVKDTDIETLLTLLRTPALGELLESRGLDVDATVALLANPPEEVLKLRRFVAGTRAEIKAKVEQQEYEKAARLQQGEKDLLKRLAAAEQKWIGGETSESR